MESIIETVYLNDGNIQKYQIIEGFDWNNLNYKETTFDKKVMRKMVNLYRLNIIPKNPMEFGILIFYHLGDEIGDLKLSQSTEVGQIFDQNILLNYYFEKNNMEGKIKEVDGKIIFEDKNLQRIFDVLLDNGLVDIVRGLNSKLMFMPMCKNIGYPSLIKGYDLVCNAHFFLMEKSDLDSAYDLLGTAHSLALFKHEIISPPLNHRNAILVKNDNSIELRVLEVGELGVVFDNNTVFRHQKNAKFYTRPENRITPKINGFDYIIVNNKIVAINEGGKSRIPMAGFVIQSDIKVDVNKTTVKYICDDCYKFGIQVGPALMKNGVMATTLDCPFYDGKGTPYPSTVYPMDFNNSRAARIGLGEKDNKPVLIWAEGSGKMGYIKGEKSCGASLSEFAKFVNSKGITNLINLDGGGSSQIIFRGERYLKIADRLDDTVTEDERPVPSVIVI